MCAKPFVHASRRPVIAVAATGLPASLPLRATSVTTLTPKTA